jgi:uncharacterized protein (TIGR02466 family)
MALDVSISRDLGLVFTTPLLVRHIPGTDALNDGLVRIAREWQKSDSGAVISNLGGWQSPPTVFERPEPELQQLRAYVDEAVRKLMKLPAIVDGAKPPENAPRYKAFGWMNLNGDGDYNQLHVHPRNHWAVVYYAAVGVPSDGPRFNGRIELRDPRPSAIFAPVQGFTFGQPLAIEPKPGLLVAFPAWLEHWVHPFRGMGQRLSIATNIEMLSIYFPSLFIFA